MDVVKLGRKGRVTIPASILRKLGLEGGAHLAVAPTPDGAIRLLPIELYTDERIAEFLKEDRMMPEEEARVERAIARLRRR